MILDADIIVVGGWAVHGLVHPLEKLILDYLPVLLKVLSSNVTRFSVS